MKLPAARGPVSRRLVEELRLAPELASPLPTVAPDCAEDLQITLFICYELHYRGFDGVDGRIPIHAAKQFGCADDA